jgi:hypothetical protein
MPIPGVRRLKAQAADAESGQGAMEHPHRLPNLALGMMPVLD